MVSKVKKHKKKPAGKPNLGAVMKAAIQAAMKIAKKPAGKPAIGVVMKAAMKASKVSMKVMKIAKPPVVAISPMKAIGKPLKSILKGPSQVGLKRDKKSGQFQKSPSPSRPDIDYDKLAEKVAAKMNQKSQPKDKKQKGSSF